MKSNNNNQSNNKKNTNNRPAKPITKVLPFVVSGQDARGNEYDAASARDLVATLHNGNVFDMLSVMATITRANLEQKEDLRGTVSVARVVAYDEKDDSIKLQFFGKNVEKADAVDNMVVIPHVRFDRATGKVTTISGFEIVNMMDA